MLRFDYRKHQVSLKDMDKYWDKKNVYILDLRSAEQYKSGHIKGALHLGADILEDKLFKLVPDKKATIIVYCNNSLFPSRMLALTDTCLPQFLPSATKTSTRCLPSGMTAPATTTHYGRSPLGKRYSRQINRYQR
ncbi:MAG: rhodanese-like domain-containing protein [Candidatus Competibacteraceae bacterium]|nr:rhodanese-like domain-containing protein [Candidatus Competibacteraceae bacterium]